MRIEGLQRKRILYAVVDPAEIRFRHRLLFKKLFDITFVLTQRLSTIVNGDVRYFDTIDQALRSGRSYNLVILQWVGNFIVEYGFLEELEKFCVSNDLFVLSAPRNTKKDDVRSESESGGPMMVVNVDVWEGLGYPRLEKEGAFRRHVPSIVRSNAGSAFLESDSYDTTLLVLSEDRRSLFDRSISDEAMFWALRESLCRCCLYVRPELEGAQLYEALIKRDESLVADVDQKRWIILSKASSLVWIFNSEPYRFYVPLGHCDVYFGPAAGFKYLDLFAYRQDAELIFYDRNEDSLEWINSLKSNWDGVDFVGYLRRQPEIVRKRFKYVNASVDENQRILFSEFGGSESFEKLWRLFKAAKARFVKCDLFDPFDVAELTSKIQATHPFFYYSNIFSTMFTMMYFSREEVEERYQSFKAIVRERFPTAILHGADVSGRWH